MRIVNNPFLVSTSVDSFLHTLYLTAQNHNWEKHWSKPKCPWNTKVLIGGHVPLL